MDMRDRPANEEDYIDPFGLGLRRGQTVRDYMAAIDEVIDGLWDGSRDRKRGERLCECDRALAPDHSTLNNGKATSRK